MAEETEMNKDEHSVFIGVKDTKIYVFSVTTQAEKNDKIFIKARGKYISKAVDVSQITLNKFIKDWKLGNVYIGTEERPYVPYGDKPEHSDRETQDVSVIEIELLKENPNGQNNPG